MSDRNYNKKETTKKTEDKKVDVKKTDKKGSAPKGDTKKAVAPKKGGEKKKTVKKEGEVKVNKAEEAGIKLDVNSYKRWLKSHLELTRAVGADGQTSKKTASVHYMLAAVDQVVCLALLADVSEKLSKGKNGLFDLTYESLRNKVESTDYFKYTFGKFLDQYNPGTNWLNALSDRSTKTLHTFIEENAFYGNKDVSLNKDVMNFIAFLLERTNTLLVSSAYTMSEIFKKKSISARAVYAAAQVHFTGKLLADLKNKLTKVLRTVEGGSKKEEAVTEEGSGEEKATEKKTSTKKTDKKDDKKKDDKKKKVEKEEEKAESEDEAESGDEAEDESGGEESDAGSDEE